ncbi:MAG: nucleotidyltransferase family protein [Acinetobacter sp.]|uniref:sugar phosphate nucleotidyltransferase n=1 Tax=Acinetobacter sp. TaxID=472 RepID=UPI000FA9EA5E|nr:sugar phosphate nucleotidyltransferase [Acinetobacter sp.]RUP42004.1 MAG: nucleotidyltransferase family protein [Acinetobacter sp.]
MIDTIMLFAAGFGNRMRHLTENSPKTLIPVLGKPILHHALELCKSYPFKRVVINTHYLHAQVKKSIKSFQKNNPNFPEIIIIYEEELLETGGAIKNAQEYLGSNPIFTLNTDIILKSKYNVFELMINRWNAAEMDFLLLMQPYKKAVGYSGHGDFDLDKEGNLLRPDKQGNYDYMYAGLQILNPLKVAKHPLKIFSLREYYLNSEMVRGIPVKGARWYHATSPEDLVEIEMDMLAHNDQ